MSVTIPIDSILEETGLPVAYGTLIKGTAPPYLVWRGNGQLTVQADNTHYFRENEYVVEYYFDRKSPSTEEIIESKLLEYGLIYEKSEDEYLDGEKVYIIYYYI